MSACTKAVCVCGVWTTGHDNVVKPFLNTLRPTVDFDN